MNNSTTEKVFVGRYTGMQTKFGMLDKFFLSEEDILKLQDHIENKGEKTGRGVTVIIAQGQKSGKPYMCIDTWKPDPNYKKSQGNGTYMGGEKVGEF